MRGEAHLRLGEHNILLRPTFAALVAAEEELGPLFALVERAAAGQLRLTDPFDNSSNGMTNAPTATDQSLGVGNAFQTSFSIVKHYGSGANLQTRLITRVRPETVVVAVDGVPVTNWQIAETGKIEFETAPANGALVTAGFRFDVPVRFAGDRIDINRATFGAGDMPSIVLVEVKESQ